LKGLVCKKLRGQSPLISFCGFLAISAALHFSALLIAFGSGSAEKETQYRSTLSVTIPTRLPSDATIQPRTKVTPKKFGATGLSPALRENSISLPQNTLPIQANTLDAQWYFAKELEGQPAPLEVISLENEFDSVANKTGQIHLSLLISNEGMVLWAHIEESEFPDDLNDLIVKKFLDSRFTPGIRNDQSVNSFIRIEVTRSE
jgi:hypothetical protein